MNCATCEHGVILLIHTCKTNVISCSIQYTSVQAILATAGRVTIAIIMYEHSNFDRNLFDGFIPSNGTALGGPRFDSFRIDG